MSFRGKLRTSGDGGETKKRGEEEREGGCKKCGGGEGGGRGGRLARGDSTRLSPAISLGKVMEGGRREKGRKRGNRKSSMVGLFVAQTRCGNISPNKTCWHSSLGIFGRGYEVVSHARHVSGMRGGGGAGRGGREATEKVQWWACSLRRQDAGISAQTKRAGILWAFLAGDMRWFPMPVTCPE